MPPIAMGRAACQAVLFAGIALSAGVPGAAWSSAGATWIYRSPEPGSDGKIAVSLWLARDPRLSFAGAAREVA